MHGTATSIIIIIFYTRLKTEIRTCMSLCEARLIHSVQNLMFHQRPLQPTRFTLFFDTCITPFLRITDYRFESLISKIFH